MRRPTRENLMSVRGVFVLTLVLGVPSAAPSAAAPPGDWPQWRGPNRDGRVVGLAAPASWPETLAGGWKVMVGSGSSSPIVSGGRVYQFSREGEDEVVRALDLGSGRELWRQAYPAPYQMNPAATS